MSETAEVIEKQEVKDLYEVGEIPPMGHVPEKMYAWVIRRERHGEPDKAMQVEVVDVPVPDSHEDEFLDARKGATSKTPAIPSWASGA